MISLSQIQLLEEKVASAVARIMQLNQEKEALNRRCLQLEEENKSLQANLLNFERDQEQIEQGIIKVLDRLNVVENSVLQAATYQARTQEQTDEVQVLPTDFNHQQNPTPVIAQEWSPSTETDNNHQQELLQQSESDLGLAPMFSEEVVSPSPIHTEMEEQVSQEQKNFFAQNQDTDLFMDNQDNYRQEDQEQDNSAQLDIF